MIGLATRLDITLVLPDTKSESRKTLATAEDDFSRIFHSHLAGALVVRAEVSSSWSLEVQPVVETVGALCKHPRKLSQAVTQISQPDSFSPKTT